MMKPKSNVWMYGAVLVCVIVMVVVLSLGCLQQEMQRPTIPESSPNSGMPLQDDPFRGTFAGSENVSLNQPAKITFTICPIEDAPNTTIRLFLPPDVELVEGNTEWCGDVKSDEEVQVDVVIQVPIKIRGNIKASVERPANEVKIRRSYYYLISTIEGEDNVSESREIVVEMPKQDDPFKGSFVGSQTPYLNQVSQITFSVTPEEDMSNSTIKFFLPPDVELVEGDLEWHGDLKEDQQLSLDLLINVTEKVEQNIKAEALAYIDGIRIVRSYYFPISTMDEAAPSLITEPKETLIMQTMAKSISLGSQPSSVSSNLESLGYITVIGKFYYVNEDGGYSPMRHVYTELWDSEAGPDEYLGYDYTDDDGNFYYYVNNDDGWLQDGRDVYVKAWAYSNATKTTTDGDAQYVVVTSIKSDVPDGTVDFGSMYPTSYSEAWQAVDAAWSEYIWINRQVGWTRSRVHIKWPSGTWPTYSWTYNTGTGEITGQWMKLPDKSTAGWDHVTVHHEYGHAVMIEAYGTNHYNLPSSGSYPSHWVYMESDEGFATIEGWAEFMQCVVDNDPNNLQGWGQNIETNDWYNKQDSGDFDGDIIEGSFASILWDIFDPANDDGLNMGFDEIWTIMLNDRPGSIHDVWDGWFDRNYGHAQDMGQIYWNYGVNKLPDITVLFPSAPASAKIRDYITVSYALSNNGVLDSGSFHTRISLATTLYGTDIELGTFPEDSVPGGTCTAGESHEVQIPPDVSPGYYYVTVFADVFDDVTESDENNNINKAPNQICINGKWEGDPGNPCKERRLTCSGTYEYRNKPDGTDCCSGGNCDGWYDTGNTKWVTTKEYECKYDQKEQKEQEYRDYYCSGGSCTYKVTKTQWIDTGKTKTVNKPDGIICGCTANNTLKVCYDGTCTDTGTCNSTYCDADVACDGKKPGEDCGIDSKCNSTCKCVKIVNYGVDLTADVLEKTTTPNVNATYTLIVKNTGTSVDNYTLSVDNLNNAAIASLNRYSVTNLASGSSATVLLNVTDETEGTYNVSITAASQGNTSVSDTIITKTTVKAEYGVNLSCANPEKSIPPRGYALYDIIVKNTGNVEDTIDLILPPPCYCGWVYTLDKSSVELLPGESTV
ncbi:MAG: hypothetical protein DRN95_04725, partial [Candidatus Hydrothermarchaeota archaeon]